MSWTLHSQNKTGLEVLLKWEGLLSCLLSAIRSLLNACCLFDEQQTKAKMLTLALGDKTDVAGIDQTPGLGLISPTLSPEVSSEPR